MTRTIKGKLTLGLVLTISIIFIISFFITNKYEKVIDNYDTLTDNISYVEEILLITDTITENVVIRFANFDGVLAEDTIKLLNELTTTLEKLENSLENDGSRFIFDRLRNTIKHFNDDTMTFIFYMIEDNIASASDYRESHIRIKEAIGSIGSDLIKNELSQMRIEQRTLSESLSKSRTQFVVVLVIMTVFLSWAIWHINNGIVKSVKALQILFKAIGKGDLNYIQPIINSNDEFDQLMVDAHKMKNNLLEIEKKYSLSEHKFSNYIEHSPDGIFVTDENGHYLDTNPAAEKITGYSKDELITMSITDLVPSETLDEDMKLFELLKENGVSTGEIQYVHKSGEKRWWSVDGVKISETLYLGFTKDITTRKLAQEKITEEKERLAVTLRSIGDGVITTDINGSVTIMNKIAEDLTGWNQSEAIGNPISSVFNCRFNDELTKKTSDSIAELKIQNLSNHSVLIRKNGDEVLIKDSVAPILDESNKTIGTVIVFRDYTEQKRHADELKLAKDKAEKHSKSKSQFLANMSHEIRTPMNGVLGMIQLIQETSLTKEQEEYINISKTSSEALLTVINDILDYSKIEEGKIVLKEMKFDLNKILNEEVNLFKSYILKNNLKLEVKIDENVPNELIGDAFRLRQILSNIIGNAVKYTPKGFIEITVSQKNILSDDKILLEVHVKDTGIGIDLEHKNNLFTSFYQVDDSNTRKYGGSGLGLAISKSIVELMGGTIWVESEFGEGSDFIFTLEMKIDTGKKSEKVLDFYQKKPESYINRDFKILLVEDDEVSRIVATKFLEKRFSNIEVAENGQEAYDRCLVEKFDVILMDIQMPVMGGYEATRRIRILEEGTEQHTVIIATTALAYEQDITDSIEAGMDDYISKPLEREVLFEKIKQFV